MSETKYTPLEIRIVDQKRNWREINTADRTGVVIADCYEKHVNGETEFYFGVRMSEEYARLFAAAPDLLEACIAAESLLRKQLDEANAVLPIIPSAKPYYVPGPTLTALRSAIAKAEGVSK